MRLLPDNVEETVSLAKLPNYQEKFDISAVSFDTMKMFNNTINCEPILTPVHFKDTMIFFHNCTKKRFVTHKYYEPRLKPRTYSETLVIYPKRPTKVYVACIDYHIDACRKWFKTSLEFTAKTFTTCRVNQKRKKDKKNKISVNNEEHVNGHQNGEVGSEHGDTQKQQEQHRASSVFFPRFEKYNESPKVDELNNDLDSMIIKTTENGNLTNGVSRNSNSINEGNISWNGGLVNGDIHVNGEEQDSWA